MFLLTNDPDVGMLEFRFDGTVLTDTEDQRTIGVDLKIVLGRETCSWLTQPVVKWFTETVEHAVRVEFDRYIAAGDLDRTIKRLEELQAQSDNPPGLHGNGAVIRFAPRSHAAAQGETIIAPATKPDVRRKPRLAHAAVALPFGARRGDRLWACGLSAPSNRPAS